MANLTTIDDIRRLERRIASDERQRAFNRRLTERLELIIRLGAAVRKCSPAQRRMAWRAALYFSVRPYWMYEAWRDAMKRRIRMKMTRAALSQGKLEVLDDDQLLELGGEIAANGGADMSVRELETVYGELQRRGKERGYLQ